MTTATQPKIIDEIKYFLPKLSDQEYNGLKNSIRNEGQQDAIKIGRIKGKEDYFFIDGHNRYHICGNFDIEPKFADEIKEFDNLDEAKIWIIQFQFAKGSSLPSFVRAELAEKLESLIEGRRGKRSDLATSVRHLTEVKHPHRQAAEMAGIGTTT